jgi:hypothetical protein
MEIDDVLRLIINTHDLTYLLDNRECIDYVLNVSDYKIMELFKENKEIHPEIGTNTLKAVCKRLLNEETRDKKILMNTNLYINYDTNKFYFSDKMKDLIKNNDLDGILNDINKIYVILNASISNIAEIICSFDEEVNNVTYKHMYMAQLYKDKCYEYNLKNNKEINAIYKKLIKKITSSSTPPRETMHLPIKLSDTLSHNDILLNNNTLHKIHVDILQVNKNIIDDKLNILCDNDLIENKNECCLIL